MNINIKKEDVLYFGSAMKLRELSNLYECDILFEGDVYNSVENVYQSLKFKKEDRVRFMKDGDLGGYDGLIKYGKIFYGKNKSQEELNKKMEYWKKRKCIGIIAKMSSNKKYVEKLGLTYNKEIFNDYEKKLIFKEILMIKFNNKKFNKILEESKGKILIEFSRSSKRNYENGIIEKWCGLVDNGVLYGNNLMGNIIMDIRKNIC